MENGLKISQAALAETLFMTDRFPTARAGAGTALSGAALQGRIWWPEVSHLLAEDKTQDYHVALDEIPVGHVLGVSGEMERNRVMPLVMIMPWPTGATNNENAELQFWALQRFDSLTVSDAENGIVVPLGLPTGTSPVIWRRVL